MIQEKSLVLVHGPEKQGKSILLVNIAVAGALALPDYLGIPIRPEGFKTLMVQGEIHARGMWERFSTMIGCCGPIPPGRLLLNEDRNVSLLSEDSWKVFIQALVSHRPDMVIIDPFAHVLVGLDERSNDDVGKVLQERFEPLRDELDTTIALVHHDAKFSETTTSRMPHQRSRGANRLTADPDSVLSLVPMTKSFGQPVNKLVTIARYGRPPAPFRIRLNEESLWFERFSPGAEKAEKITLALHAEGGTLAAGKFEDVVKETLKVKDDEKRTGKQRTAARWIAEAVKLGLVRRSELPDGGTIYSVARLPSTLAEDPDAELPEEES